MITIVNYRERYLSDIESMDAEMAAEIARHADVCRDTVCVALVDGTFAGAGLIAETNPYHAADDEEWQYYRAEFRAVPGIEDEAEVSITLLEELQYRFGRLPGKDGRRPVLRVWVNSEDTAYTELLFDEGFRIGNEAGSALFVRIEVIDIMLVGAGGGLPAAAEIERYRPRDERRRQHSDEYPYPKLFHTVSFLHIFSMIALYYKPPGSANANAARLPPSFPC